jgi:hypothetical protein
MKTRKNKGGAPYHIFTNNINKNKLCEKEYENYEEYWKSNGYPIFDPFMTYPGKLSRLISNRKPSTRLNGQQPCNGYSDYITLHNPISKKNKEVSTNLEKPKEKVYIGEIINEDDWQNVIPEKPTFEEQLRKQEEKYKEQQQKLKTINETTENAIRYINQGKTLSELSEIIPNVLANKEIVIYAVGKNGLDLRFASVQLKKDESVVRTAYQQNKESLKFADPDIQEKIKEEDMLNETKKLRDTSFNRTLQYSKFDDIMNKGKGGKKSKKKRSKTRKSKKLV